MICAACGTENRDAARFCGNCSAPLLRLLVCPACESPNPPGRRFCDACAQPLGASGDAAVQRDPRAYTPKHLADKILASKSALEGERKQVSVLFADVKGSMELAERVDAEAWHAILDTCTASRAR